MWKGCDMLGWVAEHWLRTLLIVSGGWMNCEGMYMQKYIDDIKGITRY